jgi:hypothetical protein
VQRAARQPVRGAGDFADHGVGHVDELGVERDRLDLPDALPRDLAALVRRDPLAVLLRRGEHVGKHVGVQRALVERELARSVERGDDPRAHAHEPGRRAHVVARRGVVAEGQRAAGGGQEGVAAHVHRRRSGVRVQAGEAHGVALDAEGAEHGAERLVDRLEHRALLDVQLEVGGGAFELVAGVERAVEIDAVLAQRIGQPDAFAVGQAADGVGLQRAGRRARPQQAATEARALLVGPAHELERQRARLAGLRAQHLQAADDVQRAVEPAPVGHRVQVPADDHEALRVARGRRPDVARRIALHGDAVDPGELAAEPVVGGLPRVGPRNTLRAVVVAGQPGELAQPGHGPAGVDGRHQPLGPLLMPRT